VVALDLPGEMTVVLAEIMGMGIQEMVTTEIMALVTVLVELVTVLVELATVLMELAAVALQVELML